MKKTEGKTLPAWGAAVLLLCVHFALSVSAFWNKSPTFDETIHLVGGAAYWMKNDYRLDADVPILPDRIAALPLLFMKVKFVPENDFGWMTANPVAAGRRFLYGMGNDASAMLRASRATIAAFGLLCGLLVFAWSKSLFGAFGGLISLALFTFSPAMLAHGGLVTTDRTVAFFFLLSLFFLGRVVYRLTLPNLVLSGLSLGCLMISKASGALVIPMGLLWAGIRLWDRTPLLVSFFGHDREVRSRPVMIAVFAGLFLALALLAAAVVWAGYGFRYSAFNAPEKAPERPFFQWDAELSKVSAAPRAAIVFARDRRLLPETFLYMYAYVLGNARARFAFLAGRYSADGWWWFFPFCFAVKNPLALFPLILMAALALRRFRRRFFDFAPLLVLFGLYWAVALATPLNIGERHILPTYPPLFVLSGAAANLVTRHGRKTAALLSGLLLAYAAGTVAVWPDFLAFFNKAAGGPENGRRLLADSSLDWGQDLPGLSRWLSERGLSDGPGSPVYLSYFGTALPWYYGIRARLLPSYEALYNDAERETEPLLPGLYCISETQLLQVYTGMIGHYCAPFEERYKAALPFMEAFFGTAGNEAARRAFYGKAGGRERASGVFRLFEKLRFARLCAFLRQREPEAAIGRSIFIYSLSQGDLREALYGPPAELYPARDVKGLDALMTVEGSK